jgi:hypothetical protein
MDTEHCTQCERGPMAGPTCTQGGVKAMGRRRTPRYMYRTTSCSVFLCFCPFFENPGFG